jgi:hypothetical protein
VGTQLTHKRTSTLNPFISLYNFYYNLATLSHKSGNVKIMPYPKFSIIFFYFKLFCSYYRLFNFFVHLSKYTKYKVHVGFVFNVLILFRFVKYYI